MSLREPPDPTQTMLSADALTGQVALVTGGGSGLGLAMAKAFASCGASVGLVGRSMDKLQGAAASLAALGIKSAVASADVREADQVAKAFDQIERALGDVSILANNAGANFPVLSANVTANAWRAVTRINIEGTLFCSQQLHRRRSGRPAVILNNAATYAWTGLPGGAHAAASKAAVVNLTKTLAVEWACDGVRVNCLVAGYVPHAGIPGWDVNVPDGRLGRVAPAGRAGRLHEIGWAAVFLCSPYASYITGQCLTIDGAEWLAHGAIPSKFIPPQERESLW